MSVPASSIVPVMVTVPHRPMGYVGMARAPLSLRRWTEFERPERNRSVLPPHETTISTTNADAARFGFITGRGYIRWR
jgi:hypothetical protein